MPQVRRARGQRIGTLGTFRNFLSVLREMSFDDVRRDAEEVPLLLVLAPAENDAKQLATLLVGQDRGRAATARTLDAEPRDLGHYDAIVVFDPARSGAAATLRERVPVEEGTGPAPVFTFEGTSPDDDRAAAALRAQIMRRLPERAPAFGRALPAFRAAAAKAIIDETAKANAEFALVSNIPAIVPLVGSLTAASTDFLVLTKNQLMMLFKIAAIHGRDLHDHVGIMREMVPVVGAGLLWRSLAREAASFIPLAAGTIPKVVIAYAGTVSAGRGADFYYRMGYKPNRAQLLSYYQQAADAVKKLPLPRPAHDGAEAVGPTAQAKRDGREPVGDEIQA